MYTQVKEPRCPDERRAQDPYGRKEEVESNLNQVGGWRRRKKRRRREGGLVQFFFLFLLPVLETCARQGRRRREKKALVFFLSCVALILIVRTERNTHRNSMIRIAFLVCDIASRGHKSPNCCCCVYLPFFLHIK